MESRGEPMFDPDSLNIPILTKGEYRMFDPDSLNIIVKQMRALGMNVGADRVAAAQEEIRTLQSKPLPRGVVERKEVELSGEGWNDPEGVSPGVTFPGPDVDPQELPFTNCETPVEEEPNGLQSED